MKKLIIPLVALLSLLAGYQVSKSQQKKNPEELAGIQPRASDRSHRSAFSTRKYEESLRSSKGDRRWLSVVSVIERTPLDGLLKLAHASKDDKEVLRLIALRWASEDPQHCLKTLLGDFTPQDLEELLSPSSGARNTAFSRVSAHLFKHLVGEWAARDFTSLLTALEGLTPMDADRLGGRSVMQVLDQYDSLAALRLARKWSLDNSRYEADVPQLIQLAKTDPRQAVETLLNTNDTWTSRRALGSMLQLWAKKDAEAALNYASATDSDQGKVMRVVAFHTWLAADLPAAGAWLGEQSNRRIQDELRPTLMKEWGKVDPESALNHCLTSLSGLRQSKAIANFLVGVSSEDQSVALNLLNQLPDEVTTRRVAVALTHEAFLSNDGSFGPAHPSRRKSTPSKEILKTWFEKQNDPSIAEAVLLAHGEKLQRFAPEFKEQLTPGAGER